MLRTRTVETASVPRLDGETSRSSPHGAVIRQLALSYMAVNWVLYWHRSQLGEQDVMSPAKSRVRLDSLPRWPTVNNLSVTRRQFKRGVWACKILDQRGAKSGCATVAACDGASVAHLTVTLYLRFTARRDRA